MFFDINTDGNYTILSDGIPSSTGGQDVGALGGITFDSLTTVPEPSSAIALLGLLGLASVKRRRS